LRATTTRDMAIGLGTTKMITRSSTISRRAAKAEKEEKEKVIIMVEKLAMRRAESKEKALKEKEAMRKEKEKEKASKASAIGAEFGATQPPNASRKISTCKTTARPTAFQSQYGPQRARVVYIPVRNTPKSPRNT
jgi:hypothetical protein